MVKSSILITGSSGFIGSALIRRLLAEKQYTLRALVSNQSSTYNGQLEIFRYEDLESDALRSAIFLGVDTVIHLAGKAHVPERNLPSAFDEYRKINVLLSFRLAKLSAKYGVRRFIYLSSIKVHGNHSAVDGTPFRFDDVPNPVGPYATSKYEAEALLKIFCHQANLELVIIRPPLVYGPGVKANFNSMIAAVKLRIPLPFREIQVKRSMIYVENLVGLIMLCITHPNACKAPLLVSDGNDFQLNGLLKNIAGILGVPSRLFYIPTILLRWILFSMGKGKLIERLLLPLQVDIQHTKQLLGWSPPHSAEDALSKTVLSNK